MTSADAFRERLLPSAGVHLLSVLAGGAGALAGSYWGGWAAVTVGVVAAVLVSAGLSLTAPVVSVVPTGDPADGAPADAPRLSAGDAVIPLDALGAAEEVDAEGIRRLLGPEADARAYVCHRSWVRSAVRFEVTDERDATPYWLVCTRRPAQLIAATGRREAGA
ncbi:DUF3093 domain-containing protein [Georgenia alba]|uniref:DUF3093 domain-containing protein n=1 Tax=Georgenia alba TaxID=2233858 RepID=A0ABW2QBH1_9MICO